MSVKHHSYNERGGSYNGPPYFCTFSVKRGNLYCESRIFFSIKNEGYEKNEEMAEESDVDPTDCDSSERSASHG